MSTDSSKLVINAWADISPHFTPEEIFSPETIDSGRHLIDLNFLRFINGFRDFCDAYLLINFDSHRLRGVRSPSEQIKLKQDLEKRGKSAASLSMHVCGKAADITSKKHRPAELAELAEKYGFHGIGIYKTFIHCDLRTLYSAKPIVFVAE